MTPTTYIHERLASAFRPKFRGTLIDNCATAPMGKGHGNNGQPFDIDTACYLKPLVAAYHDPRTRKMVVLAGVKTLKSFFVEMSAAYHLCHSIGDVMIYFGSGEVADDVSTTRILAYFEGIPSYQDKLANITSRFDETNSAVKFPDKTFFLKPANLANTQQKNLGFVGIQDAFVTAKSGMIDQAIQRTTQYADDKKIVIESQGGEDGFDFDRHYLDTDQRELHVVCPDCGRAHVFNWKGWDEAAMTRPDDFVATLPAVMADGLDDTAKASAVQSLTAELLKPERKVAGFQRGPSELIKWPDGSYNEAEVVRQTYFECFHCGSAWRDTPALREKLDRSSHYVAARPNALPENVGFNFGQSINRRLPWGPMMLDKLKAQQTAEDGNDEPLKQWWQKCAARTWTPGLHRVTFAAVTATIDPLIAIPNELFRYLAVDCQKDRQLSAIKGEEMTGHFWVHAGAVDKAGNEQQLWRGYCTSWAEWIAKYQELKIPVLNVGVDGGFKPDEVLRMAAQHAELTDEHDVNGRKTGRRFFATWTMFRGDDAHTFRWPDGYRRIYSPSQPEQVPVEKDGRKLTVDVNVIRWSNFRIKNELDGILRGNPGKPKLTVLPHGAALLTERTRAMEQGDFAWARQMEAEILGFENNSKFAKPKWLPAHKQKHYRDCLCMGLVKKLQAGLLGATAVREDATMVGA